MSDNSSKNKNSSIKYILCFITFFIIGTVLGIFCTNKYLEKKEPEPNQKNNNKPIDITNNSEYEHKIKEMQEIVNNNIFYNSKGISITTMNNDQKLSYIYDYIINNKLATEGSINATYYGANTCENDFAVEVGTNDDGTTYLTGGCSTKRLKKDLIKETYQKIFNNQNIEIPDQFEINNTKCITDEEGLLCGKSINSSYSTGALTPKFEIIRVMKETNGDINIYEKGYLVDTRNNIVKSDDGFDNYYLHSSDSNEYYHELKSSDNLTFKHTFKADNNNYYYTSSEVEE